VKLGKTCILVRTSIKHYCYKLLLEEMGSGVSSPLKINPAVVLNKPRGLTIENSEIINEEAFKVNLAICSLSFERNCIPGKKSNESAARVLLLQDRFFEIYYKYGSDELISLFERGPKRTIQAKTIGLVLMFIFDLIKYSGKKVSLSVCRCFEIFLIFVSVSRF
jgi:hypothetical protein